jgi:hypothetical protein
MDSDPGLRRTQIFMPSSLIHAIDAEVGKQHRSEFIVETIAAELHRRRLRVALAEMDGALADIDIPGWESPAAAAAWVRALRDGQDAAPGPE